MEIDACLEDSLEGYETLFEGGCCHEELFEDRLFSGEMYGLAAAMRSYSELMNEGHGDAGVNLMTMLFRIFQKAGNQPKMAVGLLAIFMKKIIIWMLAAERIQIYCLIEEALKMIQRMNLAMRIDYRKDKNMI